MEEEARIRLALETMYLSSEFERLKAFRDEVEPRCRELDEQANESMRAAVMKIWEGNPAEGARRSSELPEFHTHRDLLYESLVLIAWHKVEELLMRAIGGRSEITKEEREKWTFRHIRAYFKGAGHPLCGMPQSNKVFGLKDVANSIKHRGGLADTKRLRKYATKKGPRIRLKAAHLDEWFSACPVLLRAVFETFLADSQ